MILRRSVSASAGLIVASSVLVFAQQPQTPAPGSSDPVQRERRLGRMRGERDGAHRGRFGFGLEELSLTNEQRQQAQAILQRHLESTRAQRDELLKLREKRIAQTLTTEDGERAKALHQQIRDSTQRARNELSGILTAEQRTQLEQIESQRNKARHR